MYRLISSGLLVAATTGSLLVVGTPASASATTGAPVVTTDIASTQVKPTRIKQVRYTCHPESAIVSLKLRNPNKVELSWQVQLSNDDLQEAQAVTLVESSTNSCPPHLAAGFLEPALELCAESSNAVRGWRSWRVGLNDSRDRSDEGRTPRPAGSGRPGEVETPGDGAEVLDCRSPAASGPGALERATSTGR